MKVLLLSATAMVVSATAGAQVVNGGFEAPTVSGPCCTTTPPEPLPGWDVTGDVNVVNGTFSSSPAGTNLAFEGTQYLDLVGQSGAGSISQAVATTAGLTYEFTFAYSHNLFGGLGSASASYSAGSLAGTVTHGTGTASDLDWQVFTGRFTATGSSTTISFANLVGGQNDGVFLDGIGLSAVPEPATWALMILGFGAIGGAMRRRRATLALA